MRLYLCFILLIIFTVGVGCSVHLLNRNRLSLAYIDLVEGEIKEARAYIEKADRSYNGNFLNSCLELSEGNITLAKFYANQLVAENSEMAEGRVLVKLIERRDIYPEENWMDAFAFAWQAVGSPKLTLHMLFDQWIWEENSKRRTFIRGTSEELLFSYETNLHSPDEEFVELCIANTSRETPLEIKLLSLIWLDDKLNDESIKISDALRVKANKKHSELIRQLSVELQSDIRFAVRDILSNVSINKSFSLIDISHLEEAVKRRRLGPLRKDIFILYLERYLKLGFLNPQISALNTTSLLDNDTYWINLREKAVATAKGASKKIQIRLADILKKVGMAHLKRKTFIDSLSGSDLLFIATKISDDNVLKQQAKHIRMFTGELIVRAHTASSASLLWPIKPLQIDSVERHIADEISVYQLLTGMKLPVELSSILRETEKKP